MALLTGRGRPDRGVAAMEFALTIPIFLGVVGAIVYFSIALLAKFTVLNVASTTARTCVVRQMRSWSDADFIACANNEFQQTPIYNTSWNSICNGSRPTLQVLVQPAFTGGLANTTKLLVVRAGCQFKLGRVMWLAGKSSSDKTSENFQVTAAMPFTISQPSG